MAKNCDSRAWWISAHSVLITEDGLEFEQEDWKYSTLQKIEIERVYKNIYRGWLHTLQTGNTEQEKIKFKLVISPFKMILMWYSGEHERINLFLV